jgi:hypothetical protein
MKTMPLKLNETKPVELFKAQISYDVSVMHVITGGTHGANTVTVRFGTQISRFQLHGERCNNNRQQTC